MIPKPLSEFVERLVSVYDSVESIISYPHPFSPGGLAVVFKDCVKTYAEMHAMVLGAGPPELEKHIVNRKDLFLLGIPDYNALSPHHYPHMAFFVKHKGRVLYGCDLRAEIPLPAKLAPVLDAALDTTGCWFRCHNILNNLQQQKDALLLDTMNERLIYLMSVALLIHTGKWDVQLEQIPSDFREAFTDQELVQAWQTFDDIRCSADDLEASALRSATLKAVWCFEVFARGLRRYV